MVSCRICKGDHWTTRCPYKDTLAPIQDVLDSDKKKEEVQEEAAEAPASSGPSRPGKYVPPNLRDGGNRRGETMSAGRNRGMAYWYIWCQAVFLNCNERM